VALCAKSLLRVNEGMIVMKHMIVEFPFSLCLQDIFRNMLKKLIFFVLYFLFGGFLRGFFLFLWVDTLKDQRRLFFSDLSGLIWS